MLPPSVLVTREVKMNFRHKVFAPLLLASISLSALSACGGDDFADGSECEPSGDAGSLTVYSGRGEYLVGDLLNQYVCDTGVDLEVRYGKTAELAAQIQEEGLKSPADVFFAQDAGALGAVDAAGLCLPTSQEITDKVPASYRAETGNWTGVTGRARVIAYDSSELDLTEVPPSVLDLVEPQWAGEVAIAPTNGSFQAFVTGMRVAFGEEVTETWLKGLIDNDVQTYDNNIAIQDAVDAGQVQLGLINHYYWYRLADEIGEENVNVALAFTEPGDPGGLVNVAGACVLSASENPAEGTAFIEWLLSDAAQEWFVDTTTEYPLAQGIPGPAHVPPIEEVSGPDIPLAEIQDLPGTLEMLERVGLN